MVPQVGQVVATRYAASARTPLRLSVASFAVVEDAVPR